MILPPQKKNENNASTFRYGQETVFFVFILREKKV